MSERLTKFLVSLATDPDRLQRFAANSAAELDAAGLTDAEKAAVLSQDTNAVRRALGQGIADHMTQVAQTKAPRKAKRGGKKKKGAAKKGAAKKKK